MGVVAKSYMRKGFLIYEEKRKYLSIYEEAVSHIQYDFATAPFWISWYIWGKFDFLFFQRIARQAGQAAVLGHLRLTCLLVYVSASLKALFYFGDGLAEGAARLELADRSWLGIPALKRPDAPPPPPLPHPIPNRTGVGF
jgi:hypothetical protein